MTLELPRIRPASVNNKMTGSFGMSRFTSDSGSQTTVLRSAAAVGFSIKVNYNDLSASEAGEFLTFLNTIKYDATEKQSAHAFYIGSNHPLWVTVLERDYIESLLIQDTIDEALWRMVNFGDGITTPVVNINEISFGLQNVRR